MRNVYTFFHFNECAWFRILIVADRYLYESYIYAYLSMQGTFKYFSGIKTLAMCDGTNMYTEKVEVLKIVNTLTSNESHFLSTY